MEAQVLHGQNHFKHFDKGLEEVTKMSRQKYH